MVQFKISFTIHEISRNSHRMIKLKLKEILIIPRIAYLFLRSNKLTIESQHTNNNLIERLIINLPLN